MHHHTAHFRAGLSLDDFQPTPTEALQIKLNVALSFIFTGNLPIIVERGKQMESEVVAEAMRIARDFTTDGRLSVDGSHGAQVDAGSVQI